MNLAQSPGRFLVCVVLLALLTACGGASASVSPTSTGGSATTALSDRADAAPSPMTEPAVVAAAATSAPAMAAEATAAPASEAAPRATISPAATTAPAQAGATQPIDQAVALKAGAVDDNAEFAAYEAYLKNYRGDIVLPLDVSEHYVLTVTDGQQRPVLDAIVRVSNGDQVVFKGRTYAGGKVIVFPRTVQGLDGVDALQVEVSKGNAQMNGLLQRGQDSTQEFVLPGVIPYIEPTPLDVVFLLDATGSMGDEIYQVQRTIRSIAERIDGISPRPQVRFGLVAYRDQGDDYVTRVYNFTDDVEVFRETLRSVSADGGGDEPEALVEGLAASVNELGWADDAVRLVFLVADAPPHIGNNQNTTYLDEIRNATARGVKIFPIAASNTPPQAEYVFRQLAQQTLGRFIFLTYDQGKTAGTPGETTTMNVDSEVFTVDRLDDVVVLMVERELALAEGRE